MKTINKLNTVKLSTPFWLGDMVYSVIAFPAGEWNKSNKVNYFVKALEIVQVHYIPSDPNVVCFDAKDNETGKIYFSSYGSFAKFKDIAEEAKAVFEKYFAEWQWEWMVPFENHKNDGILMGGFDRPLGLDVEYIVKVVDNLVSCGIFRNENGEGVWACLDLDGNIIEERMIK